MDNDNDGNPRLKIILVGEAGVGKTQLINVMNDLKFDEKYEATLTTTSLVKQMDVGGTIINVHFWDTMGEEKRRTNVDIFFKGSKIVIFVYSIIDRNSFKEIEDFWLGKIQEKIGKDIILGLVGNKSDLYKDKEVENQEGIEYAAKIGAKWILTSAKDDEKREEFKNYVFELVKDYAKKVGIKINDKTITLLDKNISKQKGKKCC